MLWLEFTLGFVKLCDIECQSAETNASKCYVIADSCTEAAQDLRKVYPKDRYTLTDIYSVGRKKAKKILKDKHS